MRTLPDFQNEVRTQIASLENVLSKYTGEQSILSRADAASLAKALESEKSRCEEILATCKPKIMVYGIYNAGKSTLINALLGEKKASVADRAETAVCSEYDWQGYTLVDTPGIDAPIKHEEITKEKLKSCQVILFVVSAEGSFESSKVYHEMKAVRDMGKRLLIVLNNKKGIITDSKLNDIKVKIQHNLQAFGYSAEEANDFRIFTVNAKDAYDAKEMDDEELLTESALPTLEETILFEVKKIDGFKVIGDYLNSIVQTFEPYIVKISDDSSDNDEILAKLQGIHKLYRDFSAELLHKVDEISLPISNQLLASIPENGVTNDVLKASFDSIFDNNHKLIWEVIESETSSYKEDLLFRLGKFQETVGHVQVSATTPQTSSNDIQKTINLSASKPEYRKFEEAPTDNGASTEKQIQQFSATMDAVSGPLMNVPVPIPGGPTIPAGVIVQVFKTIGCFIIGSNAADRENERIEQEAERRREAEETHALSLVRWKQEMKDHCNDMRMHFVRHEKSQVKQYIDLNMQPIIKYATDLVAQKDKLKEQIAIDNAEFSKIISRASAYSSELLEK